MKFIIKDGEAYLIQGDSAVKVEFDLEKKMNLSKDKKDKIDVEDETKYTYDEVLRKLNVNYKIEKALEEALMPVTDEKLRAQVDELEELNKALKEEKQALEKELEALKEELKTLKANNEDSEKENKEQ